MSLSPELASRSPTVVSRLRSGHHARMAVAEPQPVGRRHHGPAAARQDIGVLADREFRGLLGRRRQRRQARLGHVDGARGAVEIAADLALLILLDQHLQGGIFGGGSPARRGGGREAAQNSKKGAAIGAAAGPLYRFRHGILDKSAETGPARPVSCPGSRGSATAAARRQLQISAIGGSGRFCGRRPTNTKTPAGEPAGASRPAGQNLRGDRGSGRSRSARAGAATCSGWRTRRH